jgi:hypothetical protein
MASRPSSRPGGEVVGDAPNRLASRRSSSTALAAQATRTSATSTCAHGQGFADFLRALRDGGTLA